MHFKICLLADFINMSRVKLMLGHFPLDNNLILRFLVTLSFIVLDGTLFNGGLNSE